MAKHGQVLIGLALVFLTLALNVSLAACLDALNAFDFRDLLFDADPNTRILTLTANYHLGIKHPNFSAYFSLPMQGLAAFLHWSLFPDVPTQLILRNLAVFLVPVLTAFQTAAAFMIFVKIGMTTAQSVIATLLNIFSMSHLIFGSMPESFGISGLAITLLFLMASSSLVSSKRWRYGWYFLLCFFATGVTISNLGLFAIVMFLVEWRLRCNLWSAVRPVAAITVLIFVSVGVSSLLYDNLFPSSNPRLTIVSDQPLGVNAVSERIKYSVSVIQQPIDGGMFAPESERHRRKPLSGLQAIFAALRQVSDVIMPVGVNLHPVEGAGTDGSKPQLSTPEEFAFAYVSVDTTGKLAGLLYVIALVLAGAIIGLRAGGVERTLTAAALAVIGYSYFVHLFFGWEVFLYSQHWQFATVFLAAMVMLNGHSQKLGEFLVAALVTIAAISNAVLISNMLRQISEMNL